MSTIFTFTSTNNHNILLHLLITKWNRTFLLYYLPQQHRGTMLILWSISLFYCYFLIRIESENLCFFYRRLFVNDTIFESHHNIYVLVFTGKNPSQWSRIEVHGFERDSIRIESMLIRCNKDLNLLIPQRPTKIREFFVLIRLSIEYE